MKDKLRAHIEQRVPLTDEEFAVVLAHFTLKQFRKHQFLIQEGQSVKYCYYVASGLLKLVYTDQAAKQHIVSFAMEDWWEGDFQAFFTQSTATLSVECLEDTVVFGLSLDNFYKLCTQLPKFERFLLKLFIESSVAGQQRILSFMTNQAKDRYEQLLEQYPSLAQRVPKSLLASYLGVSRETLSRLSVTKLTEYS